MASNAMNTSQLACWIPEYQAAKALAALEKSLVVKNVVWNEFQNDLAWGDIINIPITPNLGTADSVSLTADLTLNAQNTTRVSIAVNQWNYKALGVGYREKMQNRPDYLAAVAAKCIYSCADAVDVYLAGLFNTLTAGNVGTQGSALTDDVMISAIENLNENNIPFEDRSLVVDPESITDLLKIDKFLREDYVTKGAVESAKGLVGRSVYGGKVWMTNNLEVQNSSYHSAAFLHKEAIAVIIQKNNLVDMFDWKEKFTNVVRAQVIFGAKASRPTAGVCVNTRS